MYLPVLNLIHSTVSYATEKMKERGLQEDNENNLIGKL